MQDSLGLFLLAAIGWFVFGLLVGHGRYKRILNLYNRALKGIETDANYLGSLVEWRDELEKARDELIVGHLRSKKHPAKKASEEVRNSKAEARDLRRANSLLQNRLYTYEAFAPWLADYVDLPTRDLLSTLKESDAHEKDDEVDDPVRRYLTDLEWRDLPVSVRNQMALDRYSDENRRRDPWSVGVQYERYIGYLFEEKGYRVLYHGAVEGKTDLGIDLICESETEVFLVQCKRLSVVKGIPIRENVVAQLFGSSHYYRMENQSAKTVRASIYTTFELSDQARRFANHLEIDVNERILMGKYPLIKCNISAKKEKIYHLPMDQQYDKVRIERERGEQYAHTVEEAEGMGYRRAYRWSGANGN